MHGGKKWIIPLNVDGLQGDLNDLFWMLSRRVLKFERKRLARESIFNFVNRVLCLFFFLGEYISIQIWVKGGGESL